MNAVDGARYFDFINVIPSNANRRESLAEGELTWYIDRH